MNKIGKVVPIPRGDYDAGETYNHLDFVRYNGASWYCKTDNLVGVAPTEGENWTAIAEKGAQGDVGDSITATSTKVGKITTVEISNSRTGEVIDSFQITDGEDGEGSGNMRYQVYDTDNDGIVNRADVADSVDWTNVQDAPDFVVEPNTEGLDGYALITDGNGGRSWGQVSTEQYIEDSDVGEFSVTNKKLSLSNSVKGNLNTITSAFDSDNKLKDTALSSSVSQKLSAIDDDGKISADDIKSGTDSLSNKQITDKISAIDNNQFLGGNVVTDTYAKAETNGVSATKNSDGTLTLHGTATAHTWFTPVAKASIKNGKTYKLCGVPKGFEGYSLVSYIRYNGTDYMEDGSGITFTAVADGEIEINVHVLNGTNVENAVVKLMVTEYTSATYDDYIPFSVKSNKQLTDELSTVTTNSITCDNSKGTISINKFGKVVVCNWTFMGDGAVMSWAILTTLSSEYRPIAGLVVPLICPSRGTIITNNTITINSNGTIVIAGSFTPESSMYYGFSATWLTK